MSNDATSTDDSPSSFDRLKIIEERVEAILERIAEQKEVLMPDDDLMSILARTPDGRQDVRRIREETISEIAYRKLNSIYDEVLRIAEVSESNRAPPEQPAPNWLHARAGIYCGELMKFCEGLSFSGPYSARAGEGIQPPAGATNAAPEPTKKKGKLIDARMLKTMVDNPASLGWSARQWAAHLNCSDGSVKGTPTWKGPLKKLRMLTAAEGMDKMDSTGTHPKGLRKTKPKSD